MPTSTRAAVLRQRGQPYSIETVELADPGPGQVLVKLAACGICFTDVGVQRYEQGTPLPQVLGHEGAGTVLAVGEGVTTVAAGDRVVLSYASCGACPSCSHDHPQYCANFMALNYAGVLPDGRVPMSQNGAPIYGGFFGQSSFADHAIAYARNTVKLADDVSFALAAPFGCGLQTGAGTAYNTLNVQADQAFAVMGAGSVGLAALLAAVDRGCHTIIAVDRVAERLELARKLGATHMILADGRDLMLALREVVATGIDRIVDTTGASPVIRAGLEARRALQSRPAGDGISVGRDQRGRGRHGQRQGGEAGARDGLSYLPVNCAGRFCRKALTPSTKSADRPALSWLRRSTIRPSESDTSRQSRMP
ncbi:MAG: hypothetical protein B7Z50_04580 [Sphingomonadales bacterium 12-62-5]|nr:MAG: hypothetical protein B7Z50_04580 [Sphingomonadales bacterium 12-62-5]